MTVLGLLMRISKPRVIRQLPQDIEVVMAKQDENLTLPDLFPTQFSQVNCLRNC